MSRVAKSSELSPNPFLGPLPIERENKGAAAGPINSGNRRGSASSLDGVVMTKTHEFHDLADIFPMLAGDEAKALAQDISEHGLREPITLLAGKILDGRNRYIACLDAGVEPRFTKYNGDNPAAYVVSLNLKRRHLDESQRAMVAKKLATLEHGQRQTGKFAGVTTQAEAASMLNVSERSVRTAGVVIDKAVPEIVTAVEKGDLSVSAAAQFAEQSKEEQAKQIAESAAPADAVKAFRDSRQIKSAEPVGDDGGRAVHPNDSKAGTHLIGEVIRFAEFFRANLPVNVASGIPPGEVAKVRTSIAVINEWLGQFVAALGGIEATEITAKAAEAPRGPDIVPPAKHEPVAAASHPLARPRRPSKSRPKKKGARRRQRARHGAPESKSP
jgi:hypothetical protein